MGPGKICPECGSEFFNLKAHQGKSVCRRQAARLRLERAGYAPVGWLFGHLPGGFLVVPKVFLKFVKKDPVLNEEFLPKWVHLIIIKGWWTEESIKKVEEDPELQAAFTLEYNVLRQA